MKASGTLLITGMLLALVGIFFKLMLWIGAGFILTISLMLVSLVSFIQFFISLATIKTNKILKVIGALLSYAYSLAFVGILFRFQFWEGSGLLILVSTLMLVVLTIITLINRKKIDTPEARVIIRRNYFLPWCFICFFFFLHYVMPVEMFYNTFSSRRAVMSYQQMLDERTNENTTNQPHN